MTSFLSQVNPMLFCVLPCLDVSICLGCWVWMAPKLIQPPYTMKRTVQYSQLAESTGQGVGVKADLGRPWEGGIWGNIIPLYVWSGWDETDWSSMRQAGIADLLTCSPLLPLSVCHSQKHTGMSRKSPRKAIFLLMPI